MAKTLYLAGGLFNAAERMHNLHLEKHLKLLGYEVVLPQREALKFFDKDHFDIAGIVADCKRYAMDEDSIYVGCVDGPNADSGTAVEYGMAIAATGRAIVYRTDFRTDMSKELGLNAMLTAQGTQVIYHPCFATEIDAFEEFYAELAREIDTAVKKI